MSVDNKTVTKIARLSRIEVSEEKKPAIAGKLNTILEWMNSLNEVNTNNVKPLSNVHEITMPMAKDEVKDGGITESVLKNAPDAKYNYFTVPKMIE